MIVLVESNFVIEFAQRQSEIADAERIVTLAENREIELAIPACALFEPYETLVRRRKQRAETVRKLRDEIRQLGRSQHSGPEIETYFEQMGCKLFASFANTRQYVESVARRIGRAPPH